MTTRKVVLKLDAVVKKSVMSFVIFCFALSQIGCVTRNAEEARHLVEGIAKHLSEKSICHTTVECGKKFDLHGEDENGVNLNIYDSSDRVAVSEFIAFVVEHGIDITGGVPITITVYPKLRKDYGNYLIKPKHIIKIEVTE